MLLDIKLPVKKRFFDQTTEIVGLYEPLPISMFMVSLGWRPPRTVPWHGPLTIASYSLIWISGVLRGVGYARAGVRGIGLGVRQSHSIKWGVESASTRLGSDSAYLIAGCSYRNIRIQLLMSYGGLLLALRCDCSCGFPPPQPTSTFHQASSHSHRCCRSTSYSLVLLP
jgi:hypothetical protein